MMATAMVIAFAFIGFIVMAGYLFGQLAVLALEILSKVMEELR
jgi:hypothetical protein